MPEIAVILPTLNERENLAPMVERLTGGTVNLRILSNLADRRCARASLKVPEMLLAGNGFTGTTSG